MKTHAILIDRYGGPEALTWKEVSVHAPGPGEALVRQTAVGNGIWFDKVRPLARANFWSWLIKMNIVGIVAALLIK